MDPEMTKNPYDSTEDSITHIRLVQSNLMAVVHNLTGRALVHDASKLVEPEKSGYDRLQIKLQDVKYGTIAYKAALDEAAETIEHHYAKNDHHPNHYPNGITDMSLLSIMEMLADWYAACKRTKEGDLATSISINALRYGMSPQLVCIFRNTALELGWIVAEETPNVAV